MSIRFACPGCKKTIDIMDSLRGRRGKCPGCGAMFVVPQQSDAGLAIETKTFPPELLAEALKAFNKRVRLTQLDDESQLGHGPFSSGKQLGAGLGIKPPDEFPAEVWEALVTQGSLRRAPGGLYELAVPGQKI
ncbi:MAG: hypothetical protein PHU85_05005 [Phycisphaerae bacterium]|nr:hypothetical protein [Phycisphaerae bacterium]